MTFAGVEGIAMVNVGHDVIKLSVGQTVGWDSSGQRYVFALDYRSGDVVLGARMVRRSFWQRLRAAWRVLRGGLP